MLKRFSLLVLIIMLCTLGGVESRVVHAADIEVKTAAYTHTINNNTWGTVSVSIDPRAWFEHHNLGVYYRVRMTSTCRLSSPYGSGGIPYVITLSSIAGSIILSHHQKITCDYDIYTTPQLNSADVETPASMPVGASMTTCRLYSGWGAGSYKQQVVMTGPLAYPSWVAFYPTDKLFCTTDISQAGGTYSFKFNYKNSWNF